MTMNKLVFALVLAVACSGTAVAQGFTIADDVLGAHNVNGHGCASCHAPHSGAVGNGGSIASTGEAYLWGRDFYVTTYQTFGYDAATPTNDTIVVTAAGFK